MRQSAAVALAVLAALVASSVAVGPALAQQDPRATRFVHVLGFGDLVYMETGRDTADGFQLGQTVGHMNAGLSERLTLFGEVSATPRSTGFVVELERVILRYDFTDVFKLSLGRYHTPISYWNVAFHHGLWLQTTVARPELIKFGGRLIPVHFVGLLAEGTLPVSEIGVGYTVGFGNGRGAIISRAGDAGDANSSRAWTLGLLSRPAALFGLEVGVGIYGDRVTPETGPAVDELILSTHVAFEQETPEFLAEYAWLRHDSAQAPGPAVWSDAFYVQVAYRLPVADHALKPYVRVERVDVPTGAPLIGGLGLDYDGVILGVRADVAPFAALKGEFRRDRVAVGGTLNSFVVQASFAIAGSSAGQDDRSSGIAPRMQHFAPHANRGVKR